MARKTILETYYTFTASTRTVVIPRAVPRERLTLITNVTTNTVIYNFSDASLKATSYVIDVDPNGNTTTTVVLNYNTAAMSNTDSLSIVIDDFDESFKPAEAYQDPVSKLRTSQPQALIDTDFEYGTQSTKWESVGLIANRPFAYYNSGLPIAITNVSAVNGSRIITVATTSPPAVGTPVYLQETTFAAADGLYIVESVSAGTNFTYSARTPFTGTTGTIYDSTRTVAYQGYIFTNAAIGSTPTIVANATNASNVQVTTSIPHGLLPGNEIALTGTSASTFAPNGSWIVSTVANSTSFSIYPTSAPTGSITGGTLYVRPQGQLLHRAFDGGIGFSTFSTGPNEQYIRQTRRYFRYQSGKGIQMSTGTVLKPPLQVDQIASSGTTVTVYTKIQHNLIPGAVVQIYNCNEIAYNGNFTVTYVIDNYRFQYTALTTPSATPASGQYQVSAQSWYGSQNKVGMFDQQNGMFFEFDGQSLFAVRRSSTYQLSGTATLTTNSCTVTGISNLGVSTLWTKQLSPGDFVVLKGMSYRVQSIASDTSMTIIPAYRGPTTSGAVISKTIDFKVPQSQWNMDRCDGTGPSGYIIDLTRMQMLYMDYSWYGAGFIRWGFRGTDGTVIYCHKLLNNNINFEAYMRSGNLPAHYETATWNRASYLTQTMNNANGTCYISDTTNWPSNGSAYVRDSTGTLCELINYTGLSADYSYSTVLSSGHNVITLNNTTGLTANMVVQGNGIPVGTTIQTIVPNSSLTLSSNVLINGTQTLVFNPKLTGLTRAQPGGNLTVGTTANSAVVTAVSTSGVQIGQVVYGTGIPIGSFVMSYNTNSNITLSQAATAAGSITATFAPYGNSTAQTFNYSAAAPISVELVATTIAPLINHWGTSVIMDGRYDDDKSFVFTLGTQNSVGVVPGLNQAIQSFRVAPSVSNGITGSSLGTRELVNRMQLILRQIDALANGNFLITLRLNATANIGTPIWTSVGGSSLAQYINHTANTTVSGGETIYGFYLNSSGGVNFTSTQQDLALVRDLGTSILSGGTTVANTGIYPDGPDIVTICAQNIGTANANIFCRLSWTEAQA